MHICASGHAGALIASGVTCAQRLGVPFRCDRQRGGSALAAASVTRTARAGGWSNGDRTRDTWSTIPRQDRGATWLGVPASESGLVLKLDARRVRAGAEHRQERHRGRAHGVVACAMERVENGWPRARRHRAASVARGTGQAAIPASTAEGEWASHARGRAPFPRLDGFDLPVGRARARARGRAWLVEARLVAGLGSRAREGEPVPIP